MNSLIVVSSVLLVSSVATFYVSGSEIFTCTVSCKDIKERAPSSVSGEYQIRDDKGNVQSIYCNMDTLCGSDEGWTRLARIDMTDPSEDCPGGLKLYEANGKRACGRPPTSGNNCYSIKYPSHGIQYSRVCGKIIGYQFASPDAVDHKYNPTNDINSFYVDGISVTRGNPRHHIWTLMGGLKEDNSYANGRGSCPCQTGYKFSNTIPSFVGDDYYCESGNPAQPSQWKDILYTDDPLWDGNQCRGLEAPCCVPGLPWFNKQLGTTTSDGIEVRLCSDQGTSNEDTPIEQLEIYVN